MLNVTFKCSTAGSKGGGGLVIIVGGATGEDTNVKGTALTQNRPTFPNLSLLVVYC